MSAFEKLSIPELKEMIAALQSDNPPALDEQDRQQALAKYRARLTELFSQKRSSNRKRFVIQFTATDNQICRLMVVLRYLCVVLGVEPECLEANLPVRSSRRKEVQS